MSGFSNCPTHGAHTGNACPRCGHGKTPQKTVLPLDAQVIDNPPKTPQMGTQGEIPSNLVDGSLLVQLDSQYRGSAYSTNSSNPTKAIQEYWRICSDMESQGIDVGTYKWRFVSYKLDSEEMAA